MVWESIVSSFAEHIPPSKGPDRTWEKTHKRCKDCEKVLPLKEFYGREDGCATSRCKSCYMVYQKGLQRRKRATK